MTLPGKFPSTLPLYIVCVPLIHKLSRPTGGNVGSSKVAASKKSGLKRTISAIICGRNTPRSKIPNLCAKMNSLLKFSLNQLNKTMYQAERWLFVPPLPKT